MGDYEKKSKAQILSALRRFEENLLNKKVGIDALELLLQSHKKKLLRSECNDEEIRNFECWVGSQLGVIEGVLEKLIQEPDVVYGEMEGNGESEGGFHKRGSNADDFTGRVSAGSVSSSSSFEFSNHRSGLCLNENELETLGSEVLQGCSGSRLGDDCQQSKVRLQPSEVEQLLMRLKILEEDNQIMKKELFKCVEERSELLSVISSQFQIIQQDYRHQVAEWKPVNESSIVRNNEDVTISPGLTQVLRHEPSPSMVTKVRKEFLFTLQNCTGQI